jgi:hypothetical protein
VAARRNWVAALRTCRMAELNGWHDLAGNSCVYEHLGQERQVDDDDIYWRNRALKAEAAYNQERMRVLKIAREMRTDLWLDQIARIEHAKNAAFDALVANITSDRP